MGPRRSGSFPGSEAGNVLSPRSSETGGLGVKMVEYVLGSSPTNKDLESRMRSLVLVSRFFFLHKLWCLNEYITVNGLKCNLFGLFYIDLFWNS